jgi:spore coat protein U-like protein
MKKLIHKLRCFLIKSTGLLIITFSASCGWCLCSMSVVGVNFGSYDVFSGAALESTGTIDVNCDARTAFSVILSTGASGDYTTRYMTYLTYQLRYNLYRNAAMNRPLGDGTGNTVFWSVNNARNRSFTIYGRIPARQNVYAGMYSDNITVTLYF